VPAATHSDPAPLLVERDGAVATLLINDAPRNRMGLAFMDALEIEVERLAHDTGVRALVVRGAGEEHFSVGMDLKQLPQGVATMGSLESDDQHPKRDPNRASGADGLSHATPCAR